MKTWIIRITVATGLELEIEVGPWTNIQRLFARGAREFLASCDLVDGKVVKTTEVFSTEAHLTSIS